MNESTLTFTVIYCNAVTEVQHTCIALEVGQITETRTTGDTRETQMEVIAETSVVRITVESADPGARESWRWQQ